ncbi:MAG: hypothetical protein P8Y62_07935 [candidate division WOR-3 bacterium]
MGREPRKGGVLGLLDRKEMDRVASEHLTKLGVRFSGDTPIRKLGVAQKPRGWRC